MPDYERFATNHRGLFMEDHTVISSDGFALPLYKCRECWAITTTPALHSAWHDERGA